MFLVAVRGFSLQSLVSAGNAELGACLFSAILHVGEKKGSPVVQVSQTCER